MAGSFNRITLVGNLTRDPEIRYVGSGAAVAKFSLAINSRSKEKDETMYVDIIAWDKLAETCNTYLKKGMSVLIDGRLSIRSYETKEGEKRKATEVVANTMQMLDKANGDRNGAATPAPAAAVAGAGGGGRGAASYDDEEPFDDGDIPF
jgi:single-strand DNA-binding protein